MAFREQTAGHNALLLFVHLVLGMMEAQLLNAFKELDVQQAEVRSQPASLCCSCCSHTQAAFGLHRILARCCSLGAWHAAAGGVPLCLTRQLLVLQAELLDLVAKEGKRKGKKKAKKPAAKEAVKDPACTCEPASTGAAARICPHCAALQRSSPPGSPRAQPQTPHTPPQSPAQVRYVGHGSATKPCDMHSSLLFISQERSARSSMPDTNLLRSAPLPSSQERQVKHSPAAPSRCQRWTQAGRCRPASGEAQLQPSAPRSCPLQLQQPRLLPSAQHPQHPQSPLSLPRKPLCSPSRQQQQLQWLAPSSRLSRPGPHWCSARSRQPGS